MLESIWEAIETILGLGEDELNYGQMAVRAVVTFAITVALVRFGDKRMFGKGTAFDTVVAIMIGSVMSRAVTGQSPFGPTVLAGAGLVGLHWLLAAATYRLDWFGPLVKGNPVLLVKDGEVQPDGTRYGAITRNDLEQALRMQGHKADPSTVERAYLERDGSISIVPREGEPRVLDVTVADGVQTIRIALE